MVQMLYNLEPVLYYVEWRYATLIESLFELVVNSHGSQVKLFLVIVYVGALIYSGNDFIISFLLQ